MVLISLVLHYVCEHGASRECPDYFIDPAVRPRVQLAHPVRSGSRDRRVQQRENIGRFRVDRCRARSPSSVYVPRFAKRQVTRQPVVPIAARRTTDVEPNSRRQLFRVQLVQVKRQARRVLLAVLVVTQKTARSPSRNQPQVAPSPFQGKCVKSRREWQAEQMHGRPCYC